MIQQIEESNVVVQLVNLNPQVVHIHIVHLCILMNYTLNPESFQHFLILVIMCQTLIETFGLACYYE